MGAIGDRFQAEYARRMLRIGTTATITKRTVSSYDPATGAVGVDTVSVTVKGVFDKAAKSNYRDGATDTRSATRIFLIPATDVDGADVGFEVNTKYQVAIAGQVFGIEKVEAEIADDVVVYSRLFLENA